MENLPWSKSKLRQLGEKLRGFDVDISGMPTYEEVWGWHNDLCADVQRIIAGEDWAPLVGDVQVLGTSRAKTKQTLAEKLVREHPHVNLSTVNDLAGVRYDLDLTLDVQGALAESICALFPGSKVKDLRDSGTSGYRAVHVLCRHRNGRVEIQLRTKLQGAWANAYERAGDLIGREIRYGALPVEGSERMIVERLQEMSLVEITELEKKINETALEHLTLRELEFPPAGTSAPIFDSLVFQSRKREALEESLRIWKEEERVMLEKFSRLEQVLDSLLNATRIGGA